jgi:hypothetical protein
MVQEDLNAQSFYLLKVATKGHAFLIYVIPSPNVEPHPHEIPS